MLRASPTIQPDPLALEMPDAVLAAFVDEFGKW